MTEHNATRIRCNDEAPRERVWMHWLADDYWFRHVLPERVAKELEYHISGFSSMLFVINGPSQQFIAPAWLPVVLGLMGKWGRHPGRWRRRLGLVVAPNQDALHAAYRLGGEQAVRDLYAELKRKCLA